VIKLPKKLSLSLCGKRQHIRSVIIEQLEQEIDEHE